MAMNISDRVCTKNRDGFPVFFLGGNGPLTLLRRACRKRRGWMRKVASVTIWLSPFAIHSLVPRKHLKPRCSSRPFRSHAPQIGGRNPRDRRNWMAPEVWSPIAISRTPQRAQTTAPKRNRYRPSISTFLGKLTGRNSRPKRVNGHLGAAQNRGANRSAREAADLVCHAAISGEIVRTFP